jgi:hypothetical protein
MPQLDLTRKATHACGERLERAFGDFWMLAIPDNLMQK